MKKLFFTIMATLSLSVAMAQAKLDFPFQGGNTVMADFFKTNVVVDAGIIQRWASGMVMIKFTSDEKGSIKKMVIYYADDASLVKPVIDALKKTDGKWIVPAGEKTYDFIIPFAIGPENPGDKSAKGMLQFYKAKTPISATDQIPLNLVTLLPTVKVSYAVN